MIFGSLGFLIVSAFLLAFGIGKSSVPMLVLAFVCSAFAGLLLVAAYRVHRLAEETGEGAGSRPLRSPFARGGFGAGAGLGAQPIILMPVRPDGTPLVTPPNGGAFDLPGGEPIVGYDAMTAGQITALVRSGALTPDQLEAIRGYEASHQARKSVLSAIDAQPATN